MLDTLQHGFRKLHSTRRQVQSLHGRLRLLRPTPFAAAEGRLCRRTASRYLCS